MAFVRHKMVKGKKYYQLVRNYREEGKHRQEVICHLGVHNSLDTAIEKERRVVGFKVAHYKMAVSRWDEEAARARRLLWNRTGKGVLPEQEARVRWQEWHRKEAEQLDEEDDYERLLLFWSLEYHEAKKQVARYEALANACPARLKKLLDIRQKYDLQKHPHNGS